MSIYFFVILATLVFVVGYVITLYNELVSLKNQVAKNWANIDILLKQRNSELTKLIESCQEYMKYEQATLEKIIQARNAMVTATDNKSMPAVIQAESALQGHMKQLFALAENYPDLKTHETFNLLQRRISELESSISDRRELYNESVNFNNTAIQQFPAVFIANSCHFMPLELFKVTEEEKQDVSIKAGFKP